MNDIQEKLAELQGKGWTLAAIADELGVTNSAVEKWKSGARYPGAPRPYLLVFEQLSARKRIPKRRRYAPGEHHTQRKSQEAGD